MLLVFSAILGVLLFPTANSKKFTIPIVVLLCLAYFNQYHYMATSMLLQYLPFVAGLVLLNQLLHRGINTNLILVGCRIVSIVESCWLGLNFFKVEPLQWMFPEIYFSTGIGTNSTIVPIMGSLGNPVPSSILIACTLPLFLHGKWRYFLPLCLFSLYLANSASAFMAFLVAIGTWGVVKYEFLDEKTVNIVKKGSAILFGISLFCFYLYKKGFFYASERLIKWPLAIKFNDGPVFGKGLGFFKDEFPAYSKGVEAWGHAHNIGLDLYCAFGFVGIAVIIYLLAQANYKKNLEVTCCFLGLLTSGMFYSAFHQAPLALIGIVLYSIMANKEAL